MLIGREKQLHEIQNLLESISESDSRCLLISGETGVGKSDLLQESLRECSYPQYTNRAKSSGMSQYGLIAPIIRSVIESSEFYDVNLLELSSLGYILSEIPTKESDSDIKAIASSISYLIDKGSSKIPLVFLLEDIQWADSASLMLFVELLEIERKRPLIILGSYCDSDINQSHPLREFRSEMRKSRKLYEILLPPLSKDFVMELLKQIYALPPSVELHNLIMKQTNGNPFYTIELAKHLKEIGSLVFEKDVVNLQNIGRITLPESINDAIILRLQKLSENARATVNVAATIGVDFPLHLLKKIGLLGEGYDELIHNGIIKELDDEVGLFTHEIIRDAIYSKMNRSEKSKLHLTVASEMEKLHFDPGETAKHYLAVGEYEKGRVLLLQAAENACAVSAFRDAAEIAHQALELWPKDQNIDERLQTLEKLVHCANVSGQVDFGIKAIIELLDYSETKEQPLRRAEAFGSLAMFYGLKSLWEKSISARFNAAEEFLKGNKPENAATELYAAGSRLVGILQLDRALDAVRRSCEIARKENRNDIVALSMGLEGNILSMRGDFEEGKVIAREGLQLALKHNLTDIASDVYRRLASTLEYASEYKEAKHAYFEALTYCKDQGAVTQEHVCLSCMSALLFITGDLSKALEMSKQVIESEHSPPNSKAVGEGMLGLIATFRGEYKNAHAQLDKAMQLSRQLNTAAMDLILRWSYAMLEWFEGNRVEAERQFTEFIDRWHTTQDRHDSIPPLACAAIFFGEQKRADLLSKCCDILSIIASDTGNNEALASLSLALGESALFHKSSKEAVEQFEHAYLLLDKIDIPLMQFISQYRYGYALYHLQKDTKGVELMQDAYKRAKKFGFRPLASMFSEEIQKIDRSKTDSISTNASTRKNQAGLTKRQLEVGKLLAHGLTNKEIGDKLFLSVRTIDMHVTHLLERLDCRSRSEVVKKLSELDLLDDK